MPVAKPKTSPHNKLLILVFLISLFTLGITALSLKRAHDLMTTSSVEPVSTSDKNVSVRQGEFVLQQVGLILPGDGYRADEPYSFLGNSYNFSTGEEGYQIEGSVQLVAKDPQTLSLPNTKASVNSVVINYGGITRDFSEGREMNWSDVFGFTDEFKRSGNPGQLAKIGEISFDGGTAYLMKGIEKCVEFCVYPQGDYYAFIELPRNSYGFGALVFQYPSDKALTPFQEYLSSLQLAR